VNAEKLKAVLLFLQGKKTYVVVAGIVVSAVYSFIDGSTDLQGAINQVLGALGLATLRSGVNTAVSK
jgi:hypothetical protein